MQLVRYTHYLREHRKMAYTLAVVTCLLLALGFALYPRHPDSENKVVQSKSVLDKSISTTSKQLSANPKNVTLMVSLCNDYLQKVRETADTSYYTKCSQLLDKAVAKEPRNASVLATQASLAYGRHNFTEGLTLAQKAVSIDPNHAAYYGLVGDGQIELGQYTDSVTSFQTMVTKRPDFSSYNRVAYIREIYGDISGAQAALRSALDSGSSFPENIAYSQVELGKLYARTDLDQAEKLYNQALDTYQEYPPALEGLGKVAFARREYTKAISYFERAFNALPLAQYANDMADTYKTQGNKTKATQQYYLADLAFDKSSLDGVNNDFEKAVYLTDHDRDLPTANTLSRKAVTDRPNIFSFDGLAWNLYKQGKYQEAQTPIQTALDMGSHEPIVLYHAGMIAAKMRQNDQAKIYLEQAFALDNHFLESHFSLLDYEIGTQALKNLK